MPGTDAQHTFFHWLHQGSYGDPVYFIVCQHADHGWPKHHKSLLANCLAQREALLKGKTYEDALQECLDAGMRSEEHTSELQSLMRISYAVLFLKKNRSTIDRRYLDMKHTE